MHAEFKPWRLGMLIMKGTYGVDGVGVMGGFHELVLIHSRSDGERW